MLRVNGGSFGWCNRKKRRIEIAKGFFKEMTAFERDLANTYQG